MGQSMWLKVLFSAVSIGVGPLLLANSNASNAASQGADASQVLAAPAAKAVRLANRALTKKVSEALARTRGLNSTRIIVKCKSGVVTLFGSVADSAQISLAVQATQNVEGVKSVQNQIRIDGESL
jgi:hyperosmotically inducible protein